MCPTQNRTSSTSAFKDSTWTIDFNWNSMTVHRWTVRYHRDLLRTQCWAYYCSSHHTSCFAIIECFVLKHILKCNPHLIFCSREHILIAEIGKGSSRTWMKIDERATYSAAAEAKRTRAYVYLSCTHTLRVPYKLSTSLNPIIDKLNPP